MGNISRRHFLRFVVVSMGFMEYLSLANSFNKSVYGRQPINQPSPTGSNSALLPRKEYSGTNLSGWEIVLGDAIYAAPGEGPVIIDDIEIINNSDYSQLKANTRIRRVMAHNITFKRIYDNNALQYVHTATYIFQLPYQPSTNNSDLNGETVEGHLSVWDGAQTKLEYLVAFQWIINPWSPNYGVIQVWDNPGVWKSTGIIIIPDQSLHKVQMVLDPICHSTKLTIDEKTYPSNFVTMSHPEWGNDIAARFAAEIVSLYPGEEGNGALHKADFKNWSWIWDNHKVYLPSISMRLP